MLNLCHCSSHLHQWHQPGSNSINIMLSTCYPQLNLHCLVRPNIGFQQSCGITSYMFMVCCRDTRKPGLRSLTHLVSHTCFSILPAYGSFVLPGWCDLPLALTACIQSAHSVNRLLHLFRQHLQHPRSLRIAWLPMHLARPCGKSLTQTVNVQGPGGSTGIPCGHSPAILRHLCRCPVQHVSRY